MKSKTQFLDQSEKTLSHAERKELAYLFNSGTEKAIVRHIQGKEQMRWK